MPQSAKLASLPNFSFSCSSPHFPQNSGSDTVPIKIGKRIHSYLRHLFFLFLARITISIRRYLPTDLITIFATPFLEG
jgi:hypothetical protein